MKYNWNTFLSEGELKTAGIVVCLDDKQQFLIIRRSNIDEREGQWNWRRSERDQRAGQRD